MKTAVIIATVLLAAMGISVVTWSIVETRAAMLRRQKGETKMETKDSLFGKRAQDKITGFKGIVVAKTIWMFGCTKYCLVPPAAEDKVHDGAWFDEGRLEVIGEGCDPQAVRAKEDGGMNNHPACY